MNYVIHNENCLNAMRKMPSNSIDSIVTDPPYGLKFMGKKWDCQVPSVEIWKEALRVLKPGGHLLCFAGTRTQHRMAVNIEDAGFDIRDMISWVYGSGMPKQHNISKNIDKFEGKIRQCFENPNAIQNTANNNSVAFADKKAQETIQPIPVSENAIKWDGWGILLKPAFEPITVARKPIEEKTIVENVLKYGTGGINIDGCRIEGDSWERKSGKSVEDKFFKGKINRKHTESNKKGRFPTNFIHDGSNEVLKCFPYGSSGSIKKGIKRASGKGTSFGALGVCENRVTDSSKGSASRFFYCAKASKVDRDEGLNGFESTASGSYDSSIGDTMDLGQASQNGTPKQIEPKKNIHPTVKPTKLMRYLVRLVTPPKGTVLDPFTGSGSTGKAAMLEGFSFVGCELDNEYCKIAEARIKHAFENKNSQLF